MNLPTKLTMTRIIFTLFIIVLLKNHFPASFEHAKYVLATRGKEGMTLIGENNFQHIRGVSKEVYDVSGAGDTVISYLAVGLANNFDIVDTARLSNIASSIEVSKMGTYAVSIEEIKEHISKENEVSYDNKMVEVDELVKIIQDELMAIF